MTRKELLDHMLSHIEKTDQDNVFETDCELVKFLLRNCEISVSDAHHFFVSVNCNDLHNSIMRERMSRMRTQISPSPRPGVVNLAYTGYCDFGHTSPRWEDVISLGIYGLRQRILEYRNLHTEADALAFYDQLLSVYDAALEFMQRAATVAAGCNKPEISAGLSALCQRPPQTLFEAIQTSIVYYSLQQYFDGTKLRTLGRLDQLLYAFYQQEDPDAAKVLIQNFLLEIDSFRADANIPFAIGGTDTEGHDLCNPLSYALLDGYLRANTTETKLHILCTPDTPEDLLRAAFAGIRKGKNSIVFMCDGQIISALERLGANHEDAVNYHVVGCYECGANEEITCSCNARVNLPKALEFALNRGKDMLTGEQIGLKNSGQFATFDDLIREYYRQVSYLCACAMDLTNQYEAKYHQLHGAPIFSATYRTALERAGDLYCDHSAKYCNSSLNGQGLATAVNSLAAIRKLVYEDKTHTLQKLVQILKNNWQGFEPLRLYIKNKFPKYGNGDAAVDRLASSLVAHLASTVNGHPNAKGGIYRLGLFSIDWRWAFGEKTAASADGRVNGEPLSQNSGATFGTDKHGATAHLRSVASLDTVGTPNATIVDIDLHLSAVQGENGLNALVSTLKTHFSMGGFAVHYNILDKETLIKAKENPENYPNLQVRLCGWNVLFSTLTDREKDEFIARFSQ